MNLKEHNDIVQKLLNQLEQKQQQNKQLNKQLTKLSKQTLNSTQNSNISSATHSSQQEKQKIKTRLTKQYTQKINGLNQQIKTLKQQNKDLLNRLNLKNNIQIKEKEHIVEVMKKACIERKPGSKQDHRISALIQYYDEQLKKKDSNIQALKRQVKTLSLECKGSFQNHRHSDNQEQYNGTLSQGREEVQKQSIDQNGVNEQISKLKQRLTQTQKTISQKNEEIKSIKTKYTQLTKEYYRVMNEYGVVGGQVTTKPFTKKSNPNRLDKNYKQKLSNDINSQQLNPLSNLLSQVNSQTDQDASISVDFEEKFKKFNNRPLIDQSINSQTQTELELTYSQLGEGSQSHQQEQAEEPKLVCPKITRKKYFHTSEAYDEFIYEVLSILNLEKVQDIIAYLSNISIKIDQIPLYDAITRSLHQFFYKFGMGKVGKTDMIEVLQHFQDKVNKWIQNAEMLDEICIEVGAKRNKLAEKIGQLKKGQKELLIKLKKVEFVAQLNKAQKLLEFIDFFQLDKSSLSLPEQLKNIYNQLKLVDKFVKHVNHIWDMDLKDKKPLQQTLDLVLKKLCKYAQWQEALENQKQTKIAKKKINKTPVSVQ